MKTMKNKCPNTISGKHRFIESVPSGKFNKYIDREGSILWGHKTYDYVQYFYLRCIACSLVDDTKERTKCEIDNMIGDEGL